MMLSAIFCDCMQYHVLNTYICSLLEIHFVLTSYLLVATADVSYDLSMAFAVQHAQYGHD